MRLPSLPPRRELAAAVLGCAAAAGVVLLAAGRPWVVETVARPAPLTDERVTRTGADLAPWLPALGLVALAGAGALLATRGRVRRAVGWVLVAAGVGVVVAGVAAGFEAGAGSLERSIAGPGWAVLCAFGGAAVMALGAGVAARGHRWPAMGARYERDAGRSAALPAEIQPKEIRSAEIRAAEMWRALDRGEDPTA